MPAVAEFSSRRASGATSMPRPSHTNRNDMRTAAFCPPTQANTSARGLPPSRKQWMASARRASRRRRSGTSLGAVVARSVHRAARVPSEKGPLSVSERVIAPVHGPPLSSHQRRIESLPSHRNRRRSASFGTVNSARSRSRGGASLRRGDETTVWRGAEQSAASWRDGEEEPASFR